MAWLLSYCVFMAFRLGVGPGVECSSLGAPGWLLGGSFGKPSHGPRSPYVLGSLHSSFTCRRNTRNKHVAGCEKIRKRGPLRVLSRVQRRVKKEKWREPVSAARVFYCFYRDRAGCYT